MKKTTTPGATATTLVAIDNSGSTGGSRFYWGHVKDIVDHYSTKATSDGENVRYAFWNTDVTMDVKLVEVRNSIANTKGTGNTIPDRLVAKLSGVSRLVLVTDGEVDSVQVEKVDTLMTQAHARLELDQLTTVDCYVIGRSADLSVTTPFIRGRNHKVTQVLTDREPTVIMGATQHDFELLNRIDSVSLNDFMDNFEGIKSALVSLNMGKNGAPAIRQKLLVAQQRLGREIANTGRGAEVGVKIRQALATRGGHQDEADRLAREMVADSRVVDNGEISKKINFLVSLCGNMQTKFSPDSINSNKIQSAPTVAATAPEALIPVDLDNGVDNGLHQQQYECPVSLDVDTPCLLIRKVVDPGTGKHVALLQGLDVGLTNDLVASPLRFLNYPHLVEALADRLDHMVGSASLFRVAESPITRQPVLGSLPLGETHQHVKAGDYTLAQLLTNGRALGNTHLWYAVVWKVAQSRPWLADYRQFLDTHLRHRMETFTSYASMTGLINYVITKVPLSVALWFVLTSGDKAPETLRLHLWSTPVMAELADVCGIDIPTSHRHYIGRLMVFAKMFSALKDKRLDPDLVKGLYQNYVLIKSNPNSETNHTQIVLLDGPAAEEQKQRVRDTLVRLCGGGGLGELGGLGGLGRGSKMTDGEWIAFCRILAPTCHNKTLADVPLPFDALPSDPVPVAGPPFWSYETHNNNNLGSDYRFFWPKVCPATFRPFYAGWREQAEQKFGPRYISCFRRYIDYVEANKQWPTVEQYVLYCYKRYVQTTSPNRAPTLPAHMMDMARQFIEMYERVIAGVSVDDFIKIATKGHSIPDRQKMETQQN